MCFCSGWIVSFTLVLLAVFSFAGASGAQDEPDEPEVKIEDLLADASGRFAPLAVELCKDGGEEPKGNWEYERLIRERLPLRLGGIVWDARHALVVDPCMPDRFIKRMWVEFGRRQLPAKFVRFFRKSALALVEVEGELPGVEPVKFGPPPKDLLEPLWAVSFSWGGPGWRAVADSAGSGLMRIFGLPGGESSYRQTEPCSLIYDAGGALIGFTPLGKLWLDGTSGLWLGRQFRHENTIAHQELEQVSQRLIARMDRLAFEAKLVFRREEKLEEGLRAHFRHFVFRHRAETERDEASNEWHGTGFPIGPSQILIGADLGREPLVRLERIEVAFGGERRPCRFVGALRELGAIVVEPEGWSIPEYIRLDLPGAISEEELFLSVRVDHATGRRRTRIAHDRLAGWKECFRGKVRMQAHLAPEEGTIAFDGEGRVLAIALSDRLPPGEEEYRGGFDGPHFVMVEELSKALEGPDAFDPALRPLPREAEKRLVWLGVEYQRLSADLARVHSAEVFTRGGKMGLLVIHVYEGSPAARLGLKKSDILLRLEAEGVGRHIDLDGERFDPPNFGWMPVAMIWEIPEEFRAQALAELPPPWPSQRNPLTELLTELGEGKKVRLAYLRDGAVRELEFELELGPPDFEGAPKFRSEELGLTVKELTYEVRHYYRLGVDDPALIVSGVEPGGKAALAKLAPYVLIRRANGKPVRTVAEFENILREMGRGSDRVLELTVEQFGKTRLLKIRF